MIINYLQCAVHPPLLPNLFALFPDRFSESRVNYTELVDIGFDGQDIPGEWVWWELRLVNSQNYYVQAGTPTHNRWPSCCSAFLSTTIRSSTTTQTRYRYAMLR
jgi:hypothetical protein